VAERVGLCERVWAAGSHRVAVLKYRLYDIDRLINRTVVYGLLTAVLGLCYVAGSLVFVLVAGAGADPPSWLVAAAAPAAAAVFRPGRRRIQALVDRRFNTKPVHDPPNRGRQPLATYPGNLGSLNTAERVGGCRTGSLLPLRVPGSG
jgi:hypothetical protein